MVQQMYVAIETFVAKVDGKEVTIAANRDLVAEGHELLKRYPDNFRKAEARFSTPEVEQATAAPGERRGVRA